MTTSREDILLKEYAEVAQMFRALTDIRFRLLSYLPVATGATAAVSFMGVRVLNPAAVGVALFGLVVTGGLAIYNARNDQLYNELVGRAAAIERALFLHDGQFANRPRAWLEIQLWNRRWKVKHDTALWIIYGSAIGLWLTLVIALTVEWLRREYLNWADSHPALNLPVIHVADPTAWVVMISLIVSARSVWRVCREIGDQVTAADNAVKDAAVGAYNRALESNRMSVLEDSDFIKHCVGVGVSEEDVRKRGKFYRGLDMDSLVHYVPWGAEAKVRAAHLVALITDLPPRWIARWASEKMCPSCARHLPDRE